jgi:transposase
MERQAYPTDVRDDAWTCVAPYVTVMTEDAPQRAPSSREVLHGLRWMGRAGAAWRLRPPDLPPWYPVAQHSQRWLTAGGCETRGHTLRVVLRPAAGRPEKPSAAIFDRRPLPSPPESGTWAAHVTAANEPERSEVCVVADKVQAVTGDAGASAVVEQGYAGAQAAQEAAAPPTHLEVVKLPEANKGLVVAA